MDNAIKEEYILDKVKKIKASQWAIIFGLVIISFVLFVSANYANEFWKGIINTIASALMISGVLGIIDKVFMSQDLINSMCERVELKKEIDKLGVLNITTDVKHEVDYRIYINKSKRQIDIIHAYAESWTKDHIEYLLDNISENNTSIRVLLVDPNSDLVNILALQYGKSTEEVKQKITNTFEFWKEKCNERKNGSSDFSFKGNLEIYFNKGNLNTALYRMDDFLMAIHINSNHAIKSNVIPGIVMKNNNTQNSLYSVYSNEIDELFKEARLEWSLK